MRDKVGRALSRVRHSGEVPLFQLIRGGWIRGVHRNEWFPPARRPCFVFSSQRFSQGAAVVCCCVDRGLRAPVVGDNLRDAARFKLTPRKVYTCAKRPPLPFLPLQSWHDFYMVRYRYRHSPPPLSLETSLQASPSPPASTLFSPSSSGDQLLGARPQDLPGLVILR